MASEHEMRRVADEAIRVDAEQLRVWADEVTALRARPAELESDNATLAAECRAERVWHDKCRCGGECECASGKRLNKARIAVDAAGALDRAKGGGA